MKFHLDGKLTINCPLEKTYASLTSPSFMISCIPDIISSSIQNSERFEAKVRVGISLVRGTVDMKFFLTEVMAPNHAKLVGDGSGAGSKLHVESVFDLSSDGQKTLMSWSSDSDLSGLIAGIGGPVLKGQSEKQVHQIFTNVRTKLEERPRDIS